MHGEKKESYVQPTLVKHDLLRDITATRSGVNNPGGSNCTGNCEQTGQH